MGIDQETIELFPYPCLISRLEDGRIWAINRYAEEALALSKTEAVGRSTAEFYASLGDRAAFVALLHQAGKIIDFQLQLQTPGRPTPFWVSASAQCTDRDGERLVVIVLRVIDRYKRMTERLAIQATRVAAVLDNLAEGVALVHGEGAILMFNPPFASMLGIAPALLERRPSLREALEKSAALRGITLCRGLQPLLLCDGGRADNACLCGGDVVTADGRHLEILCRPVPEGMHLVRVADVTAERKAQENLRSILDSMPVPVTIARLSDGVIVYANARVLEHFGMDVEPPIPSPPRRPGTISSLCLKPTGGSMNWSSTRPTAKASRCGWC
jgi:PAS domain-containing protein